MKTWLLLKILGVLNWLSARVRASLGVEISPNRSSRVVLCRTVPRESIRPFVSRAFSRRNLPYHVEIVSGDRDGDVG